MTDQRTSIYRNQARMSTLYWYMGKRGLECVNTAPITSGMLPADRKNKTGNSARSMHHHQNAGLLAASVGCIHSVISFPPQLPMVGCTPHIDDLPYASAGDALFLVYVHTYILPKFPSTDVLTPRTKWPRRGGTWPGTK